MSQSRLPENKNKLVTNLKIVLDQVENEVPMRTRNVLQDRNEMEKHVRDLAFDVLVDILI